MALVAIAQALAPFRGQNCCKQRIDCDYSDYLPLMVPPGPSCIAYHIAGEGCTGRTSRQKRFCRAAAQAPAGATQMSGVQRPLPDWGCSLHNLSSSAGAYLFIHVRARDLVPAIATWSLKCATQ